MPLSLRSFRGSLFTMAALAAPAVASATPAPAPVYTRVWKVCYTGTMKSCHSIQLQTQISGSLTAVSVTLRNLSGQPNGSGDNTTWSSLNHLRFYGTGISVNSADSTKVVTGIAAQGGANLNGAVGWNRLFNGGGLTPGVLRLNGITAPPTGSPNRRVGGCNPGVGATAPVIMTCNGEVVFSFNTSTLFTAWQLTGLAIRLDLPASGNDNGVNKICQTDGTQYGQTTQNPNGDWTSNLCTDVSTTTTVTPEPITMALLGTGLFGVGGARLRRRKKNEE